MRKKLSRAEARVNELESRNEELLVHNRALTSDIERVQKETNSTELALGDRLPGQSYRAGLITLCINLARSIGLRPTVRVLEIVFEWLGATVKIPRYQTIRDWMQRLGIARFQDTENVDDGIWLVDHSNQIGTEKVLTILRVRESQLPPPGTPLRQEDVELLHVEPGSQWKREDVQAAYHKVAAQKGHPIAVLTDGAVELREPISTLKNKGKSAKAVRDLKHFLSNRFKSLMNESSEFQTFLRRAQQTRAAVQQTELAHFTVPRLKQKSRFMNLQPLLSWASMTLWHLEHPDSQALAGIDPKRIDEKIGWLNEFKEQLKEWAEYQMVISKALQFFNANGVAQGAMTKFRRTIVRKIRHEKSQRLLDDLANFVRATERILEPQQRLPISTEVLESSFSSYKHLERQHAKGGFTSLLPTFGTLLSPTTTDEVERSFAQVHVADVREWLAENLPDTVMSRRQKAYQEARPKKQTKRATHSQTKG